MLPAHATASEKDCQDDQSNSAHALQELKEVRQQHKALQQAAAAAETHAADVAQRQAEQAEENAALRQEIQVLTLPTERLEAQVTIHQFDGSFHHQSYLEL